MDAMTMGIPGRLPTNAITQYPSGRWGFVGRVDARLGFTMKDGSPATDKAIADARIAGPSVAGLVCRTFATREDAMAALALVSSPLPTPDAGGAK